MIFITKIGKKKEKLALFGLHDWKYIEENLNGISSSRTSTGPRAFSHLD